MGSHPELAVALVGMAACVAASVYLYRGGAKLAATFLILAFALQAQAMTYMTLSDSAVGTGECWAERSDFYACLPFWSKLSLHAGQLGPYLLALGLLLLALHSKGRRNVS